MATEKDTNDFLEEVRKYNLKPTKTYAFEIYQKFIAIGVVDGKEILKASDREYISLSGQIDEYNETKSRRDKEQREAVFFSGGFKEPGQPRNSRRKQVFLQKR
jgi:hypothetical protein